ncbi:hypothetical protein H310_09834 [Aphanomyces invadans]|uniref:WRKY transcription factor 19 n=1 Tax=Aphanomyces invadans TaxID=157072 RepID=A0A024TTP7_9STRA|nr:hypothetical protein H310_09834 [Aphanomyces invadans]ETV96986.1 hypothetical protein H310_09834 [Aphanomyces invadans]|eukprot:XP_008874232.1 hypothetical protein H310_09834 [Aphanomyces invadans]
MAFDNSPATTLCFFNGCYNPVLGDDWRCNFHRARSRCRVDGCSSQVYARRLCVKHGGKKQCQVDGCHRNVRLGTLCTRHAGPIIKKKCIEPGCVNLAHNVNKCVRHGGGRKCKFGECLTHARSGGYCCRHTRVVKELRVAAAASSCAISEDDDDKSVVSDAIKGVTDIDPMKWTHSAEPDMADLWRSVDWSDAMDEILMQSMGAWTSLVAGGVITDDWC